MAKSNYNAQDIWRGRVKGFVYKKVLGQQVVGAYAGKPYNPNTPAQQLARAKFKYVIALQRIFHPAVLLGMADEAQSRHCYPVNVFFRDTYGKVTGATPDALAVDPMQLGCALGSLPNAGYSSTLGTTNPAEVTVTVNETNTDAPGALADDKIYVLVYCPDAGDSRLSAAVGREQAATVTVKCPAAWSGLEVHAYGFTVRAKGAQSSMSAYIGHAELS